MRARHLQCQDVVNNEGCISGNRFCPFCVYHDIRGGPLVHTLSSPPHPDNTITEWKMCIPTLNNHNLAILGSASPETRLILRQILLFGNTELVLSLDAENFLHRSNSGLNIHQALFLKDGTGGLQGKELKGTRTKKQNIKSHLLHCRKGSPEVVVSPDNLRGVMLEIHKGSYKAMEKHTVDTPQSLNSDVGVL